MEDTWVVMLTFVWVFSIRQIHYSDVIVLSCGKHRKAIVIVLNSSLCQRFSSSMMFLTVILKTNRLIFIDIVISS